ncbi:hypothetical protein L210DRAFT_864840 [Boletus edulis BED1]|uniref:Chitin-binding type-3 domain-containing protein n=1 Tax=Boletus edulis BED1 TaxID=1328754 RepID=A0AAD4GHF1_BOLED|nr:hypothetical protein L210DRAFT_864840 [Boletus edulis BED1]
MTTSTPSTTSATSTPSSSATSAPSTSPTVTATIPVSKSSTTSVTATATSTAAPGAVDCNGVQNWQAAFAYTAGDQVIFNGQLFKARQWTYNNAPPTHPDQWTAAGACTPPINNQANCNGVAAWQSTVAYTTGNRVTFQGRLWSAVQWSESNAPGDASGSWKDLGACA